MVHDCPNKLWQWRLLGTKLGGGVVGLMRLSSLAAPGGVIWQLPVRPTAGVLSEWRHFGSVLSLNRLLYQSEYRYVLWSWARWTFPVEKKQSECSFLNRVWVFVLTFLGKNIMYRTKYTDNVCDSNFEIGLICWCELLTMFCCVLCVCKVTLIFVWTQVVNKILLLLLVGAAPIDGVPTISDWSTSELTKVQHLLEAWQYLALGLISSTRLQHLFNVCLKANLCYLCRHIYICYRVIDLWAL